MKVQINHIISNLPWSEEITVKSFIETDNILEAINLPSGRIRLETITQSTLKKNRYYIEKCELNRIGEVVKEMEKIRKQKEEERQKYLSTEKVASRYDTPIYKLCL